MTRSEDVGRSVWNDMGSVEWDRGLGLMYFAKIKKEKKREGMADGEETPRFEIRLPWSTFFQIVVFTDFSFANNRDLFFQIGFVICITDKIGKANLIHWSSIKCKRITRSVFASELYVMAHEFDIEAVIKATLWKILQGNVSLILCTDSKSLYDCLVRLGTTNEKRLMIDVMSLRQSYERREITEVKWVDGDNNPADSMTKVSIDQR